MIEIIWGIWDRDSLKRASEQAKYWSENYKILYDWHQNVVEGVQGETKNLHGMRRATRRKLGMCRFTGMANMRED